MSNLNDYLAEKRQALARRREQRQTVAVTPQLLQARVRAEGRSGVRRIRIREFQIISDSGPDFAGYNLGPTSPELQLGVLGSCRYVINAFDERFSFVEVTARVTSIHRVLNDVKAAFG